MGLDTRCLTCKHWEGDKDHTNADIRKWGDIVMDLERGWPGNGRCAKAYLWMDIEIHGDATATVQVPANFGCVLHEQDGE